MSTPIYCTQRDLISIGGYCQLPPRHIIRLEARRNYTIIYQTNGRTHLVSLTLRIIEERLKDYGFIRITRGDVINTSYIRKIWKDGSVQLADGTRLLPSRRRQRVLDSVY